MPEFGHLTPCIHIAYSELGAGQARSVESTTTNGEVKLSSRKLQLDDTSVRNGGPKMCRVTTPSHASGSDEQSLEFDAANR